MTVFERLAVDFKFQEKGEPVHYSIMFLLAYLDSHISFGVISEEKSGDIMESLSENYNISNDDFS